MMLTGDRLTGATNAHSQAGTTLQSGVMVALATELSVVLKQRNHASREAVALIRDSGFMVKVSPTFAARGARGIVQLVHELGIAAPHPPAGAIAPLTKVAENFLGNELAPFKTDALDAMAGATTLPGITAMVRAVTADHQIPLLISRSLLLEVEQARVASHRKYAMRRFTRTAKRIKGAAGILLVAAAAPILR